MRFVFTCLLLPIILIGPGCLTTTTERKVENVAIAEALLSLRGTWAQSITGAWKERAFAAECVMQGNGDTLRVVFLAPQIRLGTMTVKKGGELVWTRDRSVPSVLDPEYLLFDLACVNLPTEVLTQALAPKYRVEERDGVRRILTSKNELICTRTILPNGGLKFACIRYGYHYIVQPMSVEED